MTTATGPARASMRRRRLVFAAVLLGSAVALGVLQGLLEALVGLPSALLTWWGSGLRAVLAVLMCLGIASVVDRRSLRR